MSAFNDYCIVCGQMIDGVGVSDYEHDRLYCSESCRKDDITNMEKLKLNRELADMPADLIRSPLIQPVDHGSDSRSFDGEDGDGFLSQSRETDLDFELGGSLDALMNVEAKDMICIPRSLLLSCEKDGMDKYGTSFPQSRANVVSDHTAEENYKLWLNYNFAG